MSEKGFYKKYIQNEDEKMLEIIHNNAKKEVKGNYTKKGRNVRNWLVCGLLGVILFIIGLLVGAIWL